MCEEFDYSIQYKKWHCDSDDHYNKSAFYYEKNLISHLPKSKDLNILDVGCGFGLALYAMRKNGYQKIQGIDISRQQVDACHRKNLNVTLVDDSIQWLEEHAGEFDVIISLDVLEHIPVESHLNFLRAIFNSLKKGGVFVCTVPNANSLLASRWRYIDWTHCTSFTEHSLEFVIFNSGFTNIEISEIEFLSKPRYLWIPRKAVVHWFLFKITRFFRRLEVIAELGDQGKSIPLSLNILAIAKK